MSRANRIVTLLPSATEIVCALGLGERLVGVTHECDYPSYVTQLPQVTRSNIAKGLSSQKIDEQVRAQLNHVDALYHLDDQLLRKLSPDLIVTQALCDVCAVTEEEVSAVLKTLPGAPELINLEPMSLGDVLDTILMVGKATGHSDEAQRLVASLNRRISRVTERAVRSWRPRVGFLEWITPPFNGGHWNPELIEMAGGIDCFGARFQPSRTISYELIQESDPDILIISLCGFGPERARQDLTLLQEKLEWHRLTCVQTNRIYIMDGNSYFSRPGPRLVDSLEQLADIFERDAKTA